MLFEAHGPTDKLRKVQLDTHPLCALFGQEIVPGSGDGASVVIVRYHNNSTQEIVASTDDTALQIPLEPDTTSLQKIEVDLHGSPASAYRMGKTYDAWFSECFGVPMTLVYLGDGRRAVLGKNLLPRPAQEEQRGWLNHLTSYLAGSLPQGSGGDLASKKWLSFTDVAPLMVASESSLQDVRVRLLNGLPVEMYKFRPNIVVDGKGEEPWAEDFWAEIQIGSGIGIGIGDASRKSTLQLTGNCVRCISVNVDYRTGKPADGEEGHVLKRLMKDRRVDLGSKWSPVFGRYAFLHSRHAGGVSISVGDAVEVTRRDAERSVWDWPGL